MNRTTLLCLVLALALVPACGDDTGGNPDSSLPSPDAPLADAPLDVDAMVTPDAMVGPDAMPLTGIAGARTAADGPTNVSVSNVFVTYKKGLIGGDVAGFFVQEVMTGPALFIAVDPTTLTPEPQVGDDVTFRVTNMATANTLRQADGVSDLAVNSSGNDISGLIQDVSAATDLETAIDDYEAELITAVATVTGVFTPAGTDFVQGDVDTTGVVGALRLRVPATLQDTYGFVDLCVVTLAGTPMWRFNTSAQLAAWAPGDFTATCPAPLIESITTPSATEVVITINRAFDAASVVVAGTQFTFDNGLAATGAAVAGRTVTLTTTAQSPGQSYLLTVDGSVLDILGGTAAAAMSFNGFGTPETVCDDGIDDDADGFVDCQDTNCAADAACLFVAQLYLWEVDASNPGTDSVEFVEIRNLTGGVVDFAAEDY